MVVPTFAEPDVEAGFFEDDGLLVVVGFCETFGFAELVTDAVGRIDGAGFDEKSGVTVGTGIDDEIGVVDGAGIADEVGSTEVSGVVDGVGVASAASTVSAIAPYALLY